MQARILNPAQSVPGALEAFRQLGASASKAGIPETTLFMVQLRASQINGCSVCVDIHSRELELAGESSERINTVAAWRETPYFEDDEWAALAEAANRLAEGIRSPHAFVATVTTRLATSRPSAPSWRGDSSQRPSRTAAGGCLAPACRARSGAAPRSTVAPARSSSTPSSGWSA